MDSHRPLDARPSPTIARIALPLALLTTVVGVLMAAAAASDRASAHAELDRSLITAVTVVLALGAHLLPAVARRLPIIWLLWLGCVAATLYSHAHFFVAAGARLGEERAHSVAGSAQSQAWQAELAAIQARPVAQVAAEHASANQRALQAAAVLSRCEQNSPGRCTAAQVAAGSARARLDALGTELEQSRHAAALRSQLTDAAADQDSARQQARQDPVDRELARLTGLPLALLALLTSLAQALLVELVAASLWVLALPGAPRTPPTARRVGTWPAATRQLKHLSGWLALTGGTSAAAVAGSPWAMAGVHNPQQIRFLPGAGTQPHASGQAPTPVRTPASTPDPAQAPVPVPVTAHTPWPSPKPCALDTPQAVEALGVASGGPSPVAPSPVAPAPGAASRRPEPTAGPQAQAQPQPQPRSGKPKPSAAAVAVTTAVGSPKQWTGERLRLVTELAGTGAGEATSASRAGEQMFLPLAPVAVGAAGSATAAAVARRSPSPPAAAAMAHTRAAAQPAPLAQAGAALPHSPLPELLRGQWRRVMPWHGGAEGPWGAVVRGAS